MALLPVMVERTYRCSFWTATGNPPQRAGFPFVSNLRNDHFVVVDGVTTAADSVDGVAAVVFTSLLLDEQQEEEALAFLTLVAALVVVAQASAFAVVVAQASDVFDAFVAAVEDVVEQQDDFAFFAEALSSHFVPAEAMANDDIATRAVIAMMRMFIGRSPGSMVKVGSMSEWPEK